MTRSRIAAVTGTALLAGALACGGVAGQPGADAMLPLVGADGVYTLVNLHPDEARAKLYAVNYQQEGLIPLCTPVELVDLGRKRLTFRVRETGRTYDYDYHKAAVEPFPVHLQRYFGTTCNTAEVKKLGAKDREGIRKGRALPGMTRQGVIYAIGYPPPHRTPTLEADRWVYWESRFDTMAVVFDAQGRVKEIDD